MDRATLRRLRRTPGYPAFLGAATLARVADEMFSVAVVLLVLERTGSAALAGATVAAITFPSMVSGPLLGAWLDLTGRRRGIMVFDQLSIAVALTGIVLLTGNGPNWLLPVCALVAGLTYPLSFGGFTSLIPALVDDDLLTPANAIETSSFNAALIAGPALAGVIAATAGPAAAIVVEIVLTLAALALILRIPAIASAGEGAGRSLLSVAAAGLRLIVTSAPLRGVTAAGAANMAGLGLLTVAFPLFAAGELGAAESAAGYLWAAFAIGSTAGALGFARFQDRFEPQRVVLGGVIVLGGLMLLWPLAASLPVALALVAVAGLADGPALAATFATRQRYTPRELHGQIFTTGVGVKVGSFALGAALAGPAVAALGVPATLLVAAAAQFAAAVAGAALMRTRVPAVAALG